MTYQTRVTKGMSSHARYNLGVLYQRRGEEDRALLLIRNAYNLNPKFDEAKEALRKLGAQEKKTGLGAEWFDWWFETIIVKKKRKKERTLRRKMPIKPLARFIPTAKLVIALALIAIIITSIGKLSFDLYLHDPITHLLNRLGYKDIQMMVNDTIAIVHPHDYDAH